MRKLNRKLCRGGKAKRRMKSGGKAATNKMTTYNIDSYQLGGQVVRTDQDMTGSGWNKITQVSDKLEEADVDVGAGIGGLGGAVKGFMDAESGAQKASAVGQGISSVATMIPGPVGTIGQVVGGVVTGVSEIVNAKQMKEKAAKEQLAATKAAQSSESMKILANYDSKGTGMSIAVKKGGRIPKNGVYPYQEQKFGSNLADLTISPNIHPPTRMFADGGSLQPISDTSSQVVGDNPNATDDVNMGDYYLDHDETTVETPTGMDIYSAELTIPGTKTTFADANKKLQSQKKMLPKTQARTLGHIVPKGRNVMSDLPDPKFAAYNGKIDEDAKRLFVMQELQKATPQQLAAVEQGVATAGEDMSGDIQRPQTQFAEGGELLKPTGASVISPSYMGQYKPSVGQDGISGTTMSRNDYELFKQNAPENIPAMRYSLSDARWGDAMNMFENDPDLGGITSDGSNITGQFRRDPVKLHPELRGNRLSAPQLPDRLMPISRTSNLPPSGFDYGVKHMSRGKNQQGLQRMIGNKSGGKVGYQLGGQRSDLQRRLSQIGASTDMQDRLIMTQNVYDSLMQNDPQFKQYRQNAPARRANEKELAYNLRALEGYNSFIGNQGMRPDQRSYEPSMEYDPQLNRFMDRETPVQLSGFTLPSHVVGRPDTPLSLANVNVPTPGTPPGWGQAEEAANPLAEASPIGRAMAEGNLWDYTKGRLSDWWNGDNETAAQKSQGLNLKGQARGWPYTSNTDIGIGGEWQARDMLAQDKLRREKEAADAAIIEGGPSAIAGAAAEVDEVADNATKGGGGGGGAEKNYSDWVTGTPDTMALPEIEGPDFGPSKDNKYGSYDRSGNLIGADGNIIAKGPEKDITTPMSDEVADVYDPGTPAPRFRDPNVIENYGASLLRMFQNPPAAPRPTMENMVNLREVRPDAELANLASQRATMMKRAQRSSANPNVAFGQQNRIFGMSTDAQNKIMGNVQRTNAAIQSREAMINSQIGARNMANLNKMRQQEAERKMAKQKNIVDSVSEMRAINLSNKRQQNQRELDMWRWNIAKDRFGDSGVPKRTESLLGLTDYTTGNRKKRKD